MPAKFFLMLTQFVMNTFVLATRQEYVFAGLPANALYDSPTYAAAESEILAVMLIF